MFSRTVKLLMLSGLTASMCLIGAVATAAGPPPPTSTNGNPVEQVAAGLSVPTSFAFGGGKVFAGDGGSENGKTPGGVFLLQNGTATRLAGSPPVVFGLTYRSGTLYVSALSKLLAWSGWNGTTFTTHKTLYTAPKGFTGFNGLGFGANGRLYVGVDLGNTNDHSPSNKPFAFDFLSFNAQGKDMRIVAHGLRQPWQMAFPKGSSSPFVSNLGQDQGAKNPPDYVVRVRPGQDYGFPRCNWTNASKCKGFAKPFKLFSPHTNVMGMGIIGSRLYMSEFGGSTKNPPRVVSMPLSGGAVTPLLTGFVAPVVGLGVNAGWVYVGELTGQVFRVKA
jgi:glucose/arabinose dehydrogenase